MKVLILGTGAMASFIGARVARSGHARVTMAGTWHEALEAMSATGLTVENECGGWAAAVEAVGLREVPRAWADLVIVLVKSYRTREVAAVAARALRDEGHVLTLQNGLGNRETLERACARGRVAVGVITAGATLLGPGRVRVAGQGTITLAAEGVPRPALGRIVDLLTASGFIVETVAEAEALLWRKLAVNCAVNPLSALLGVPNGALLESPPARERLIAAAREVGAVAAARGLDMEADPAGLALEVAARTSRNRSSMLQDLERGAPTEIDALCGAVAREGRRLGVPTPVNEWLWGEILGREARRPATQSPPASGSE